MSNLKGIFIGFTTLIVTTISQLTWAPPVCPSNYEYYDPLPLTSDISGETWQVCIDNNLYEAPENDDEIDEYIVESCLLKEFGNNIRRAFNAEARICITRNLNKDRIVLLTRDLLYGIIYVDIYSDFVSAGCIPESNIEYIIAPGQAYCLKDIGTVEEESIDHVELIDIPDTEGYFNYFECIACKSSRVIGVM